MATQLLDTELDVCRKYLHYTQRDLFIIRFVEHETNQFILAYLMKRVKYWRMCYNAAMAIEQSREISRSDLGLFND